MIYKYKALKNNKIVINEIEGSDEKFVANLLLEKGYFPISIEPVLKKNPSLFSFLINRITFNDIVDFTRQLAIMTNAGLTLIQSLEILKKQSQKESFQKLLENLINDIKGGSSFSAALAKYPRYFSNLYIALVKSGEASGKLSEILLKLSENLEKEREFKSKLKGALTYPLIILIAMMIVIFIMITFVVPRLLNLYKEFNIDLPLTTKILIFISSFFVKFWPLILVSSILILTILRNFFTTKAGKFLLDSFFLKIPLLNNIIKIAALVNATRTIAILIGSGVSILEALDIVVETTDNLVYQNSFLNIRKKVEKGSSLSESLDEENIFPPILVQMASVGEQTGHLDDTLLRLSKYFEMESEIAIKALTSLIEPAILVILGVAVGFLVMSVITPIYNLTTSFK